MQIHLLVYPLGHRIPVPVILQPVRSYVRGTISGSKPCPLTLMMPENP
jgi:hypothetical protein